ncbi:MAG: sigma 54-interacting transcriptional regulator [Planctomycetaceae bacterium]
MNRLSAYLVVRDGMKFGEVYRLVPGQVTRLGRAPSNEIIITDDACSRNHCEIFHREGTWFVRDLKSRNGTLIDGELLEGEAPIRQGQKLQVGECELVFTHDLSEVSPEVAGEEVDEHPTATLNLESTQDPEPTILGSVNRNPYLGGERTKEVEPYRPGRELAQLYRMALDMGRATNAQQLAEAVLTGLTAGTPADIAALLLLPQPSSSPADPADLRVVAFRSPTNQAYQPVSGGLSSRVLKDWEAVLASDTDEDSLLRERDSLGELSAKSVICAPIRHDRKIYGLIHLYSTNPTRELGGDDLQYTLAVADQCAGALDQMLRQERLAEGLAKLRDDNAKLREQLGIESDLIGNSAQMAGLKQKIGRIAPTDSTALIRGESGVGKELVARAIHLSSHRRNGPFVCMNCAALTETLLESELFGHEKGSFTGATARKIGKFEQAHRGTLFLDEVGEMGLAIQAKFLRVLEGHPFERVGGSTPVKVDVRVVAATNRDLESAVEQGQFRKDLYFRLQVVELVVEPLRQHPGDIPLLAEHFLKRFTAKTGREITGFTLPAMERLLAYDWPGNVRELQNTIERSVVLCTGTQVEAEEIHLSGLGASDPHRNDSSTAGASPFGDITLELLEQQHILGVLDRTNWNKSQAAQILGIERSTLDRKLKRYRVSRPDR